MKNRLFAFTVAFVALLPLSAQAQSPLSAQAAGSRPDLGLHKLGRLIPLTGSLLPRLSHARRLGALSSNRTMPVAISLKVRDEAGLHQFLKDLYTPGSPLFHRYLKPGQFAARFAPTQAQQQQVAGWLSIQGLRVVQRSRNGLLITAVGSVGHVESAFGTRLYTYREGAQGFFANAYAIQVPQGLAPHIAAVIGLNNGDRQHRLGFHLNNRPHGPARDDPKGMWPSTLADYYNIKAVYGAGYTGSGQTIALPEYTNVSDTNLATFNDQWAIPAATMQRIAVSNGSKKGGTSINVSEQSEAEMDIEVAHAVAPSATLLVYEGPDTSFTSTIAVHNQIMSDGRAQVISTSYGSPESEETAQDMLANNQLFEEAAAQGQSFLAASGDNGAYDASPSKDDPKKDTLQVDFPASDPWVTGVGGTGLWQRSDGSIYEKPWADTSEDPHTGGGGGLSTFWKRPDYQTGPGVQNQYSNGMRQVPDVSAFADSDPGYAVYTTTKSGTGWKQIGGTSAAAPYWGGYVALMNQVAQQPIGFLNPTLYALGQKASTFQAPPFKDVVEGDNLYYPATPGWDFASGWGSMDGVALLNDLSSMGGPLLVHPADWTMKAVVAKLQNKKYVSIRQVKRGQTIYLMLYYTMVAVPGTPDAVREFTFASPKRTLYHGTNTVRLDKSYWEVPKYRAVGIKVPANAPKGSYTLTIKMTVAGYSGQVSTKVQLK